MFGTSKERPLLWFSIYSAIFYPKSPTNKSADCLNSNLYFSLYSVQFRLPMGIEELCWPDFLTWEPHSPTKTKTYTLVLTDIRGDRTFGYCRRIQPEGDELCLPLAICILTRHSRARGLFSQVIFWLTNTDEMNIAMRCNWSITNWECRRISWKFYDMIMRIYNYT